LHRVSTDFLFRNLQLYKQKAVGAKKGFELLKKKSDALKKAFRGILQKIVESKVRMGLDFKEASLGLASAYFAAGDFSRNVLDHVKTRTNVRMNIHTENVAGVKLPIFTLRGEDEQEESSALLGLSGGGQAINRARDAFIRFLKVLITIASLQTQFVTLDQALKVTNRRVNALEFIQIPKIKNIIDFIDRELDEESREDFYRLKKVTDNKK
jgi:V-type H+-transporting ATPase subunit D